MLLARYLLWAASRVVLALRYRLRVVGRDAAARHPGPFLVLPNHPAYADPPNVFVGLWPTFKFRPMALETNFQNPVLAPIAWLARAIPVPDTAVAGAETGSGPRPPSIPWCRPSRPGTTSSSGRAAA